MIPESARAILAEAERLDGTPPLSDQALLAASQGRRELREWDSEAVSVLGEGELDLVVRPAARGRGIGGRVLAELLETADREASGELRAWAHGDNPAAEALLRSAGFEPIRTLYRLALDPAALPQAIAEARALPKGFRLETFAEAEPHRSADWVRVNSAAFTDHPEQGAMTLTDFETLTAEPWFDSGDLIFAIDEREECDRVGRVAGYTWIKTTHGAGDAEGEVETELYALGVDPDYAGRGLGAALLGATLERMAQHAPARVTLYVDDDNDNAVTLYRRAGFTVDQRSTQWLRRRA